MAARYYQYETSPRKLQPEYETKKKKNNVNVRNSKSKDKKLQKKEITKQKRKTQMLVALNCITILIALFAIIWRNSLITQSFVEIQGLKSEISEIQKENDQLEISIQNNLNLNNIEQEAKEKLGMQKLTSRQTIYLNLPKKDYVEPSTEEIILEEKESLWDKIINCIKNIF